MVSRALWSGRCRYASSFEFNNPALLDKCEKFSSTYGLDLNVSSLGQSQELFSGDFDLSIGKDEGGVRNSGFGRHYKCICDLWGCINITNSRERKKKKEKEKKRGKKRKTIEILGPPKEENHQILMNCDLTQYR